MTRTAMIRLDPLIADLRAEADLAGGGSTPLYRRLQRAIRALIEDGRLDGDEALPSERDLARALGVSRVTVRSAIGALAADGLLVQRHGAGTFVNRRVEMTLKRPRSFSEQMRERGLEPDYRLLDRQAGPALPVEVEMLELVPGTRVTRLHRLRYGNGRPMCLELAAVPADVLPERAEIGRSLYTFLAERGMRPVRGLQRLRAVQLEVEQAHLLGVVPGSAALFIEQRSFLADGRPVEYVRSHYRGDSHDFVVELTL